MELVVGKYYKIVLKDNFVYRGKLISTKDRLIDFFDVKIKDTVMISLDSIAVIVPLGDSFAYKSN